MTRLSLCIARMFEYIFNWIWDDMLPYINYTYPICVSVFVCMRGIYNIYSVLYMISHEEIQKILMPNLCQYDIDFVYAAVLLAIEKDNQYGQWYFWALMPFEFPSRLFIYMNVSEILLTNEQIDRYTHTYTH